MGKEGKWGRRKQACRRCPPSSQHLQFLSLGRGKKPRVGHSPDPQYWGISSQKPFKEEKGRKTRILKSTCKRENKIISCLHVLCCVMLILIDETDDHEPIKSTV